MSVKGSPPGAFRLDRSMRKNCPLEVEPYSIPAGVMTISPNVIELACEGGAAIA